MDIHEYTQRNVQLYKTADYYKTLSVCFSCGNSLVSDIIDINHKYLP